MNNLLITLKNFFHLKTHAKNSTYILLDRPFRNAAFYEGLKMDLVSTS